MSTTVQDPHETLEMVLPNCIIGQWAQLCYSSANSAGSADWQQLNLNNIGGTT